jgi:hypothetical protein
MSSVLRTTRTDAGASAANGFAPFAGVPPVLHRDVAYLAVSGTPYPLQRRGSEFNELAPHTPEGLVAPRLRVSRQQRSSRAPPMLRGMARHA